MSEVWEITGQLLSEGDQPLLMSGCHTSQWAALGVGREQPSWQETGMDEVLCARLWRLPLQRKECNSHCRKRKGHGSLSVFQSVLHKLFLHITQWLFEI